MIAFFDLGPNLTGVTVGDGYSIPHCDAWRFDPVGDNYGALLIQFEQYLDVLWGRFPISAVAFETPMLIARPTKKRPYADKLSTLRRIYPMGAFLEWYFIKREVPVSEASAFDLKREVTGNAMADKEDVARVAEMCGVALPTGPGRLDAGDSWAGWVLTLRHYDKTASAKWDARIWSKGRGELL